MYFDLFMKASFPHLAGSWTDFGHFYEIITGKIVSPFLSTAPLQYVPKILFTQATIERLTTNKTKNALNKETVILNYIGGDPISHSRSK